jgi:hypothetical protein
LSSLKMSKPFKLNSNWTVFCTDSSLLFVVLEILYCHGLKEFLYFCFFLEFLYFCYLFFSRITQSINRVSGFTFIFKTNKMVVTIFSEYMYCVFMNNTQSMNFLTSWQIRLMLKFSTLHKCKLFNQGSLWWFVIVK